MPQSSALTKKQVHALATRMVGVCREMNATGINQGLSGNLSVRCEDGFLITPTSTAYDVMTPEHIVHCDREGRVISGGR
ncbi:MAG: class II aldolase/adducin family protein, partial [Jhaorihella sp.]